MAEDNKKVFEKLAELQDYLIKKFALEEEIERLPQDLKAKQNLLAKTNQEYADMLAASQKAQDDVKSLRYDYDDVVSQRESSEKKMESIATQREFEALEKEIKDAGMKEEELLRQLHAKEKESKDLEASLQTKSEEVKKQQAEVDAESSKLDAETAGKKAEQADLEKKCREFIGDEITEDLYNKFAEIVKSKHGKGIVPIHGVVCQGCHIVLPIQFVNDVRLGKSIQFCPYCSRILYYEEVEGAEEQFTKEAKNDEDEDEGESSDEKGSELSDFASEDEFNDIV